MSFSAYMRLMRLDKPTGTGLTLLPALWSAALLSPGLPDPALLLALALGAMAVRGAGCVINDLWDRKIDREVARTRNRPLASGELRPSQAVALLLLLLAVALICAAFLGMRVVLWAASALPLIALYPAMKRITWFPQIFLGLTFNWGALLAAVAIYGFPPPAAWLLYFGAAAWTVGYDTIYAHQDIADDARIGVKSSARALGAHTRPFLACCYALSLALIALAGVGAGAGTAFFLLLLPAGAHLGWQVATLDCASPERCQTLFKSNLLAGIIIFSACLGKGIL